DVALAPQEAAEIAAIFAKQAQGVVFGMALQEDEQAAALPREHVDAHFRRAREHVVATRAQLVLAQLVPARMRYRDTWLARRQRMIDGRRAIEHAEAFIRERMPRDAVEVQHGRMRGEAV